MITTIALAVLFLGWTIHQTGKWVVGQIKEAFQEFWFLRHMEKRLEDQIQLIQQYEGVLQPGLGLPSIPLPDGANAETMKRYLQQLREGRTIFDGLRRDWRFSKDITDWQYRFKHLDLLHEYHPYLGDSDLDDSDEQNL